MAGGLRPGLSTGTVRLRACLLLTQTAGMMRVAGGGTMQSAGGTLMPQRSIVRRVVVRFGSFSRARVLSVQSVNTFKPSVNGTYSFEPDGANEYAVLCLALALLGP